jgi:iron complex transport system ATP-binding protein
VTASVLRLRGVGVTRDGRHILHGVDWTVSTDERWAVLGANGSGKSTLLKVAALQLHPTRGEVEVLGERLCRTDVRTLRRRVGYAAAALADQLRPTLTALEAVMTAKHAALEPWWHRYDDADRAAARERLERMGIGDLADHPLGTLSSGERQRTLVARTLMGEVGLVLLDEPTAGLDVGGREALVSGLDRLSGPPVVLVTHHLEEVPPSFTSVLLLRAGEVVAAGAIEDVLTGDAASHTFDVDLDVRRDARGRWSATAR